VLVVLGLVRPPRHCGLYHGALLGVLRGEEGGGSGGGDGWDGREEEEEAAVRAAALEGAGAGAGGGCDKAGIGRPADAAGPYADAGRRLRAAAYAARRAKLEPDASLAFELEGSPLLGAVGGASPCAYSELLAAECRRHCWGCGCLVKALEPWVCGSGGGGGGCGAGCYCSEACAHADRSAHAKLCGVLRAARAAGHPGRRLVMEAFGVTPGAVAAAAAAAAGAAATAAADEGAASAGPIWLRLAHGGGDVGGRSSRGACEGPGQPLRQAGQEAAGVGC
jgi:hypothetical protein